MGDPLQVRLFGYGVPYRVEVDGDGGVKAIDTDAAQEADALYRSIRLLKGLVGGSKSEKVGGEWAYSMPFGRCGVEGLPREHLVVHFSAEAHLDVLSAAGFETRRLYDGEIAHIEPGAVVPLDFRHPRFYKF